ncbi:MAG: hypothetical protein GY860_23345 [Desulfobacteraceae bacterium]|nr:hypothetical protein [Desulfobacteraceae bacterium]
MTQEKTDYFLVDKGGRRQIKDRRFLMVTKQTPERRTGLKRRSGWDRRCNSLDLFNETNRRM